VGKRDVLQIAELIVSVFDVWQHCVDRKVGCSVWQFSQSVESVVGLVVRLVVRIKDVVDVGVMW
jgi:hypothetical protein